MPRLDTYTGFINFMVIWQTLKVMKFKRAIVNSPCQVNSSLKSIELARIEGFLTQYKCIVYVA